MERRLALGRHVPPYALHGRLEEERVRPFISANADLRPRHGDGRRLRAWLYIVKSMVERHGGSVGVESTVGVGSMFPIRPPLETTVACAAVAAGG